MFAVRVDPFLLTLDPGTHLLGSFQAEPKRASGCPLPMASLLSPAIHSLQVAATALPTLESIEGSVVGGQAIQKAQGSSQASNERRRVNQGDFASPANTTSPPHFSPPSSVSGAKRTQGGPCHSKELPHPTPQPSDPSGQASSPPFSFLGCNGSSILQEPSPLGLTLKKTESLLDLISVQLSKESDCKNNFGSGHGNCGNSKVLENTRMSTAFSNSMTQSTIGAKLCASSEPGCASLGQSPYRSCAPITQDKMKASNFPALSLKIGTWERKSKYEGDLVSKCYYAKRKLVWEILENGLKSKIEIQWGDISSIAASLAEDCPGTLEIEISRPPMFFKETNPQPRKHTLWQATADFTGQGAACRKHVLSFPEGVLNKHYEKLMQCDPRLQAISKGMVPTGPGPMDASASASPVPFSPYEGFYGHPQYGFPPPPGHMMGGLVPYPPPYPYPFPQHAPQHFFQHPYMPFVHGPVPSRVNPGSSTQRPMSMGMHPMAYDQANARLTRKALKSQAIHRNMEADCWNSPNSVMEQQRSDDDERSFSGSADTKTELEEEDASVFDDLFLMLQEPQTNSSLVVSTDCDEDAERGPQSTITVQDTANMTKSVASMSLSTTPLSASKAAIHNRQLDPEAPHSRKNVDISLGLGNTRLPKSSNQFSGTFWRPQDGPQNRMPPSGLKMTDSKKDASPINGDDGILLDTSHFLPFHPSELVSSYSGGIPALSGNEREAANKEAKRSFSSRQLGSCMPKDALKNPGLAYVKPTSEASNDGCFAARVNVTWTGQWRRKNKFQPAFLPADLAHIAGSQCMVGKSIPVTQLVPSGQCSPLSSSPPKKKDRKYFGNAGF